MPQWNHIEKIKPNIRIGLFSLCLISHLSDEWRTISQALKYTSKRIIRVDHNLVDLVWKDYGQPDPPDSALVVLDEKYAGKCIVIQNLLFILSARVSLQKKLFSG